MSKDFKGFKCSVGQFFCFFSGLYRDVSVQFVRLNFFHDGMSTVDAFFTSAAGCKCLQRMSAESSSHVTMGVIKLGWRGNPRYTYMMHCNYDDL